jgi:hypothetical protein
MTPRALNSFAGAWHGALFVGVAAALVYNVIRRNPSLSAFYLVALGVEAYAIHDHAVEELDGYHA